jgi:hypothetical protein
MKRFEEDPSFDDLLMSDPPEHSREIPAFFRRIGPRVAHRYLAVFGDQLFYVHMQVGESLERSADIVDCPVGPRRHFDTVVRRSRSPAVRGNPFYGYSIGQVLRVTSPASVPIAI